MAQLWDYFIYFHRLFQNCIIDNPSAKLETINIIYFAIISLYVM